MQITVLDDGRIFPFRNRNPKLDLGVNRPNPIMQDVFLRRRIRYAKQVSDLFSETEMPDLELNIADLFQRLFSLGFGNLLKQGVYPIVIGSSSTRNQSHLFFSQLLIALANRLFRRFKNEVIWKNDFDEQCRVQGTEYDYFAPQGRHQRVIETTRYKSTCGLFFPYTLCGSSIRDAQDIVNELPYGFSLAGPLETVFAHLLYPEEFFGELTRPNLLMAGVNWVQNPHSTVVIGSETVIDRSANRTAMILHQVSCGFSPGRLYNCGSENFSPGLVFTL